MLLGYASKPLDVFNVFGLGIVSPRALGTAFMIQCLSDQPTCTIPKAFRHYLTGALVLRVVVYESETKTGYIFVCIFPLYGAW